VLTKVNSRWEKFLQLIIFQGQDKAQAYTAVGYQAKNRRSALSSSQRLLKNANLRERYNELLQVKVQGQVATRDRILIVLTQILNDQTAKPKDVINACKTVSLMCGYNAPARSETISVHARFTDTSPGHPEFSRRLNAAHQILNVDG